MDTAPHHRLPESAEDYLEAIGTLCRRDGQAQTSAIAEMLGVRKPSVTAALKKLKDEGLIYYTQYAPVQLTDKGLTYAQKVMNAHSTLKRFLEQAAGMSSKRADEAACHLEHWLNEDEIHEISRRFPSPVEEPSQEP